MKRLTSYLAIVGSAAVAWACTETTAPKTGAIELEIITLSASAQAGQAALDSGRVTWSGAASGTMAATAGQTVTISNLPIGTYTLLLEGWEGDELTFAGTSSGIAVEGGQSTPAPILFAPTKLTFTAIDEVQAIGATNTGGGTVTYASSNTGIATVDAQGNVTAVANGNATITASTASSNAVVAAIVAQDVSSVTVAPANASIGVGATQQFTATALDANNNPVTTPVNFLWVSSDHAVATVDQTGLATGKGSGAVTITAAGHGEPGSATLTVGTGAGATKVVFTSQPSNNTAGAAFPQAIEAELRDANDALVNTRVAVTLAIANNAGGGTLSGTVTVNSINGVAIFAGNSIDKAGTGYTLSLSSGGLTSATSSTFDISPAAAARLAFSVEPPDTEGNEVFPVEIQVTDAFGNVVTTATDAVTVEIDRRAPFGANARLLGTPTVNAVAGVATFPDLRVDVPGAGYTVSARSGALASASSAEFAVSLTFAQIDAGWDHTCGTTVNGSAYCWGSGGSGRLGNGTFVNDSVPRLVLGGLTFRQVSAGNGHTCGVTTGDQIYCWGLNNVGQLGNGVTGGSEAQPVLTSDPTGGPVTYNQVAAGDVHTCATTTASGAPSDMYCWGDDAFGQLGDNTTANTDQNIPTVVSSAVAWKRVETFYRHNCAIDANDIAWCWGYNPFGGLAINSVLQQNVPVQASTLSFSEITMGYYHSCFRGAVSPFELRCAGYNAFGQLGDATTTQRNDDVPIASQLVWSAVAGGGYRTCMIDGNQQAYCVGNAANGQLGNGTTTPNLSTRTAVTNGTPFTDITGGEDHACAIDDATGAVFCWGVNSSGQLGNGSRTTATTPVQIIQN